MPDNTNGKELIEYAAELARDINSKTYDEDQANAQD